MLNPGRVLLKVFFQRCFPPGTPWDLWNRGSNHVGVLQIFSILVYHHLNCSMKKSEYIFPGTINPNDVKKEIPEIKKKTKDLYTVENLKTIYGLIDLTSLNTTDNKENIKDLCRNVNQFPSVYPDIPNVAAICVFPSLVRTVKQALSDKKVKISSVAGGFPSSQTFLEVKTLEAKLAVDAGADEIDVVMSPGIFLSGDYVTISQEIKEIKKIIGGAKLKVILETGALPDLNLIRIASWLVMEAGADFIKTSTGKLDPAATLEATYVIAHSIHEYYLKTGRQTGIKPAGGIATTEQAMDYFSLVKTILGDNWLNPALFRIGASRLVNDLLTKIPDR